MDLGNMSLEELEALEQSMMNEAVKPPEPTPWYRQNQAPVPENLDKLSLEELTALEESMTPRRPARNYQEMDSGELRAEYKKQRASGKGVNPELERAINEEIGGSPYRNLERQAVGKAITNLPNIPQGAYNIGAMGANLFGADLNGFKEDEMPSHYIQKGLKHIGMDLNEHKPKNAFQRIYSAGVEGGAGAAIGAGMASKVSNVPYAGKTAGALFGAPKTTGQLGAIAGGGAAISGALQTLQEAGVDTSPLMLSLAAFAAGKGTYNLGKSAVKGVRNIKNLAPSVRGRNDAQLGIESIMGKENIPGAIEAIDKSNANPSSFGYKPTTAEAIKNPGISMLQETYRGSTKHPELAQGITERTTANIAAKNNKLTELQPTGSKGPRAAQEYLEDFAKLSDNSGLDKTTSATDAGVAIRKGLKDELGVRKAKRRADVGDRYSVIENIEGTHAPKNARDYIIKELQHLPENSPSRTPLNDLWDLLQGPDATYEGSAFGRQEPTIPNLSGARRDINGMLGKAKRSGDENLERIYRNVKKSLDTDLEAYPQVAESWKKYAKAKKPENEIALHGTFKKILKTSDYDAHNVLPDSGVPREIVSAAEKSQSIASDFKKLLGDKKEVMEPVKGYINDKIIKNIVDNEGRPSLSKIHKFKEKYPGAFTLYDHLDTKLKNSSNATKFLNDLGEKNYKATTKVYNDMFKATVGSKPEKMVQELFQGGNSEKKIDMYTKILQTDKTGQAWEGARRAVIDHISSQAESPVKFVKFYEGNLENLKRAVGPDEMHFLGELHKRYKDASEVTKQSMTTNSATIARDMTRKKVDNLVDKSLVRTVLDESINSTTGIITGHLSKIPGGKFLGAVTGGAYKWYQSAINSSMHKNIQQSLLEPSFMKFMLEDITTKHGKEAAKKFLGEARKQKFSGYSIGQHAAEKDKKRKHEDEE